jgi:hypothetical protein
MGISLREGVDAIGGLRLAFYTQAVNHPEFRLRIAKGS